MDLIRIGDKLVSLSKIDRAVRVILDERASGRSQGDVALRHGLDRAFLSHLESLGEVRKGQSIAVVGFPIANKRELEKMLAEVGADFVLIMTEVERRQFAGSRSGAELINEIMRLAQRVRQFDVVVLLASDSRLKLLTALLDTTREVVPMALGKGPLDHDVAVDVDRLREVVGSWKIKPERDYRQANT